MRNWDTYEVKDSFTVIDSLKIFVCVCVCVYKFAHTHIEKLGLVTANYF